MAATSLGTATVSASAATLPVSFSTAGTHILTAVFTSTNLDLTNATSAPYDQFVLNPASFALTSSVNPSLPGQSTTFTLSITTSAAATSPITPGGSVSFYNGTTLIGTSTVSGTGNTATASIADSFPTPGSYPSRLSTPAIPPPRMASATLTQVVLYTTSATLTSSVNPVDVNANTVLTAAVKSSTGTPTGTVTFKSNGITIGTGTLSGGVATLVTSFKLSRRLHPRRGLRWRRQQSALHHQHCSRDRSQPGHHLAHQLGQSRLPRQPDHPHRDPHLGRRRHHSHRHHQLL